LRRKFDPLSFAKDLQTTGFTREQAEGLAARMAAEQSAFIDDRLAHEEDIAAVRGDIESLRVSTKADIESLRISMDAKIETTAERTKSEILKWMFGTIAGQTVVLLAAMIAIMRSGIH
jgi:hypothetical protein